MKIGFDAKRLFLNYTGLGNYSRNIVKNLQEYYPEHEYHLYTTKALRNLDTEYFFDKSKFIIHENKSAFNFYWRSVSIIKDLVKDEIDIFHGLSAELPIGIKKSKIKSVVTIHDLIFKHFKSDYKLVDRLIYDFKSGYACQNAERVIAISEFTKGDILKAYNISNDKIEVVYLPIDNRFSKKANQIELEKVKSEFNLPDKFFLYVGSVIGRKNLKSVVKAMSIIEVRLRIPLVVVGSGKKYLEEVKAMIKNTGLEDDILFLKNISNEDLPKIYQLSKFFVFPSLYEGFGLPVLEAIQSGKPVVVSKGTSLEEVAGDCGTILPQNDVIALANTIKDKSNLAIELEDCDKHLKKFDPEVIVKGIMEVYKNV